MHPGNYIFNDMTQNMLGSCSSADIAVRVLTRVVGIYTQLVGTTCHVAGFSTREMAKWGLLYFWCDFNRKRVLARGGRHAGHYPKKNMLLIDLGWTVRCAARFNKARID